MRIRLWDAAGVPSQWVETLTGDGARRWYDIYRRSDWDALRADAPGAYTHRATGVEAAAALKSGRCVYIHTLAVGAEGMAASVGQPLPG